MLIVQIALGIVLGFYLISWIPKIRFFVHQRVSAVRLFLKRNEQKIIWAIAITIGIMGLVSILQEKKQIKPQPTPIHRPGP